MIKIRKISAMSLAKLLGLVYLIIGLVMGALGTVFAFAGLQNPIPITAGIFLPAFGKASIIFVPVFLALYGFILGLVSAVLYNLVAKRTGGLEVELDFPAASKKSK